MDFLLREGELVSAESMARKLLKSESLERGLLPFEVMEARGSVCFKLDEHLDRLWKSITTCGMHLKWLEFNSDKDFGKYLCQALGAVGLSESVVRISMLEFEGGAPVLLISVNSKEPPKRVAVSLKTMPLIRFMPELKLGGTYAHAQIMLRQHKEYDDMLYVHPYLGVVTEASRANFFAVIGTPEHRFLYGAKQSSLILPGITRQTLLDIISDKREAGIFSGELPYDSLGQVTEAFITSTTKRIAPVYKIDDRYLNVGKDFCGGPVTRMFRGRFDKYVEDYYQAS